MKKFFLFLLIGFLLVLVLKFDLLNKIPLYQVIMLIFLIRYLFIFIFPDKMEQIALDEINLFRNIRKKIFKK
ncbi:MAG: hypothetical protein COB01_05270 [Lutibacter sp.]|nr:MAG: hypothetical protein COB01_10695 [Lutibacter sp.]PHS53349.1 MAG: hypothetical protein COB01_05270 [Lutibacter sp.]